VIHVTDIGMLTPVGVNIGTILPIPVINRWIYQFYDEGNGAAAKSIIPNPILNTNFCAMFSIAIPRIFEHNTLAKKPKRV
ncbi:hypothetical protein ACTPEF_26700, partial [Clostridioides difficile]